MPHHKSAKKRLVTASKSRERNKAAQSEIRHSYRKIRKAENSEAVQQEMPRFFSLMDKARLKRLAGFNANRVGNYKRKVHKILASLNT